MQPCTFQFILKPLDKASTGMKKLNKYKKMNKARESEAKSSLESNGTEKVCAHCIKNKTLKKKKKKGGSAPSHVFLNVMLQFQSILNTPPQTNQTRQLKL